MIPELETAIRDPRLSIAAKGAYAVLRAADEKLELTKWSKNSAEEWMAALTELEDKGYLGKIIKH